MNKGDFQIDFLDHVAIRVKSLSRSAQWYEEVLGLKKYEIPEWGKYPIFMMSGRTGVALFPARRSHPRFIRGSKNVRIDHFAFNISEENFQRAKDRLENLRIRFKEQDHIYFKSLYFHDPDGHEVELTTLRVKPEDFYQE
ncbi:MAG: VOC family protein [Flavobacteriales bacterium]|nr:VOC family protein [Flavobacteriales bacterium]